MTAGIMAKVAAGGRRLAAQIVVSVIATGAAALLVPQILTAIGYGGRVATVGRATMPAVQAPADFEAAFVWPVQTPPPEAAPPSVMAMPAIMPVPMPAPHRMAKARADAPAPRLAALAPRPAPARPPLQLVAMTSAATASATPTSTTPTSATLAAPVMPAAAAATTLAAASPAPAEGRSLLGIAIPKLPYEDRIVAPLVRARDAVRSLF